MFHITYIHYMHIHTHNWGLSQSESPMVMSWKRDEYFWKKSTTQSLQLREGRNWGCDWCEISLSYLILNNLQLSQSNGLSQHLQGYEVVKWRTVSIRTHGLSVSWIDIDILEQEWQNVFASSTYCVEPLLLDPVLAMTSISTSYISWPLYGVFLHLTKEYLHFFRSEHTSFPDYKGSGGQRRTDRIFSLHRQRTQKRQFPSLASGEAHFCHLTLQFKE